MQACSNERGRDAVAIVCEYRHGIDAAPCYWRSRDARGALTPLGVIVYRLSSLPLESLGLPYKNPTLLRKERVVLRPQ
jgi:hypothetical protein